MPPACARKEPAAQGVGARAPATQKLPGGQRSAAGGGMVEGTEVTSVVATPSSEMPVALQRKPAGLRGREEGKEGGLGAFARGEER